MPVAGFSVIKSPPLGKANTAFSTVVVNVFPSTVVEVCRGIASTVSQITSTPPGMGFKPTPVICTTAASAWVI
jgi:hypothetical protein